jgi:diguanylate cyclase (GGDEF)-like protein
MAASMQVHRMRRVRRRKKLGSRETSHGYSPSTVVLMGTTLAGPNSAMRIVTELSPTFPASIVILQEIHPRILSPFSACFSEISPLEVIPVTDVCPLHAGRIYLASTFEGLCIEEALDPSDGYVLKVTEPKEFPIDELFESAAGCFKNQTCGVLLTGMGVDGTQGMQKIKEKGGFTLGQEQECSVYPNLVEHAVRANTVDALIPDRLLAPLLRTWVESGSERTRYSMLYDTATDLPNRDLFVDRMNQAIARANRRQKKIVLLHIELGNLTEINETLGYKVGDAVTRDVAERLEKGVRAVDTIARIGASTFAVILEDVDSPEDVVPVAQRIGEMLDSPFEAFDNQCVIDAAMGISVYPSDGATVENLLENAQMALDQARESRETSFLFYNVGMAI